ncbi:hypothetical protein R6Q59_018663 [Mikania micrantha]
MEMNSPPPCPNTVTIRRNPPRRARPSTYSAAPLSQPPSSKTSSAIRSFPIHDILSINIPDKPEISESAVEHSDSEKLKVFLRIRPIVTQQKVGGSSKIAAQKNVWPQNPKKKDASKTAKVGGKKKNETCLKLNDSHSVTLCPPQSLIDARRTKSEVYEGFSHVFCDESSQSEVYEKMMNPLVVDFLKGQSGMLAAMGPSGSGKTHTVFGSTRQPGMVSLALRQIFLQKESCRSEFSRTFYLSMFEIYSERGKGEKIMDLSQEGGDLYMQQSNIKGLKEEVIHDVQEAESLIASGMLKRSTAMTNSNIQSSRSQCIINIRCDLDNLDEDHSCTAILTIVDLAGAEREKRTGNQGARLLESNFINNTSMVFGLCLRSLLEHQKNPKKPLLKHYQNSLLTKYLRDYLEGKKRMSLILTAKPGVEDYQDTSYLLRQASPFMNIKFESIEEQPLGNKRRTQTLPKAELAKRMKLSSYEVSMNDEVKGDIPHQPHKEELVLEPDKEVETDGSSFQFPVNINIKVNKSKLIKECIPDPAKKAREYHILSNFSRALWKVLKEYKNKLEASENKADVLRHNLIAEIERGAALENELNLMKASCTCGKVFTAEENDKTNSNAQVSSHSIKVERIKKTDIVTTSVPLLPDCSNTANLDNQVDVQVTCSNHCEERVDSRVISSINDTSAVEVASTSLNVPNSEEWSSKKNNAPCEYVVFDKEDLMELGDTEFGSDSTAYDTLESGVSDSELLLHEYEFPFLTKGDQRKHEEEESNAPDLSSDLSDSECFQKQNILEDTVTLDHEKDIDEVKLKSSDLEKFEEQCKENVDISSPNVVLDKQEFKELSERGTNVEITGCDNSELAFCDSKSIVHGEKSPSFVKGDQSQLEEYARLTFNSNAHFSSSNPRESQCFEKHDILDDTGLSFVEVLSISGDLVNFEAQSKEKVDVSIPNDACNEQKVKEVEERDVNGELTVADEVSSSLEEIQPGKEEKEVNAPNTSSDLEGSKSVGNTEAPDQQLVLSEDILSSQGCNDIKFPEVPCVQPSQPLMAVKPKRRLRPASSVMLKNINILDFDDATTMPKQRNGKRGGNEDGRKITQGSISLLRILKQNLNH